jgi:hypothetical protein
VHFIQARLSSEDDAVVAHTVESVADDDTFRFLDGAECWNHDPERLCIILGIFGTEVTVGKWRVLRVPHSDGSSYCFSVADARIRAGRTPLRIAG